MNIRVPITVLHRLHWFQAFWLSQSHARAKMASSSTAPVIKLSKSSIYYVFEQKMSFLDILQNFNLLRILELACFGLLFQGIYSRNKSSKNWLRIWGNELILSNTTRVAIRITISVQKCTNIKSKSLRIALLIVITISTHVVVIIFSNSQPRQPKKEN